MEHAVDVLAARRRRTEIEQIIRSNSVRTVCQPIVSLATGRVAGFEALSRPSAAPPLDAPDVFLEAAERAGLISEADSGWRRAAFERFGRVLPGEALLFVNVWPGSLLNGTLRAAPLLDLVWRHGIRPQRVVLELMEGQTITDFESIRRALGSLRSEGFQVAIDDVGAGPSSLQSIVELRPHFIKLDRWLARDIASDSRRRSMVEAIVGFAHRTRARVVAEGIETLDELDAFLDLGVDYVQGYLLGHPSSIPAGPPPAIAERIRQRQADRTAARDATGGVQVGELVAVAPTVDASVSGATVVEMFETNDMLEVAAVLEAGKVVGIITRMQVFSRLVGQYGRTILGRKKAVQICCPATVMTTDASVRDAGRAALQRPAGAQLDPIVVLDGGAFVGVLGVTELLQHLLTEEVAEARQANPLTGLPGNPAIRRYVEQHAGEEGLLFVYADIDNFKGFNDRFGFAVGDQAIGGLGAIVGQVPALCSRSAFAGHVGGDDFVLIIHRDDVARVQRHMERELGGRWFDSNGFCPATTRLTVTIGGAPLETGADLHYEDRAAMVARVKSALKRRGGNCFVIFDGELGDIGEELAA